MTADYEEYCLVDPVFFDVPASANPADSSFAAELPRLPDGWVSHQRDAWQIVCPPDSDLPSQGWKIHVSAGLDSASRVIRTVRDYCVGAGVAFKFLRNRNIHLSKNSKYAARESSGKLVTIYPRGEAELATTLAELGERLDGEAGPYILSDLRYGSGPLYVRYGGFLEQPMVTEHGELVPAVRRPDGVLAPDRRRPGFHVPDWVELPECLVPHLAARDADDATEFPYRVRGALHFSNGGGVYLAERLADGAEVVLKEARPLAGLDRDGTDAVARLEREWETLRRLAGVAGVPAAHDLLTYGEHRFLAMEKMPGRPLGKWLAGNYPLTWSAVTDADLARYTGRALGVVDQVRRLLGDLHGRGVVFGDLHPHNLLVDDDDTVSLIDFELAGDVREARRPALAAPGFAAPADRGGVAIDDYALAALRLWLFLPLNVMLTLDSGKLDGYLDTVAARFPVPPGYTDEIRAVLRAADAPSPRRRSALDRPDPDWAAVCDSMAEAIVASATPHRPDRLFPGDIATFRMGGAGFGHGAAGVLYALEACGFGRFEGCEQWLLDAVRRQPPRQAGFLDGAHGVAHVLAGFGHREAAGALVAEFAPALPRITDHSLAAGLAGIGLNLLSLAESWQDEDHAATATRIGARLADALGHAPGPGAKGAAGLLHGWSGPALLFVRLYQRTGDRAWLGLADRALLRDLAECVSTEDGALQVRDGGRSLPYLGVGSAGVAVVAGELAEHLPNARCVERLPDLHQALLGEFVVQPGLCYGRAGQLAVLAAATARDDDPRLAAGMRRHLARLSWHAIVHNGRITFPGNRLLRLSMDVATGGAGVLLAVTAAIRGGVRVLPFLSETPRPAGMRLTPAS
ncbi:class III lanthionine synthetase LanKC [Actinokineospora iranica]|uniref:Serine/threonine protein kinase n=1 Tax=Actinokineospora iranica TaxID=1271860 RepID=A0A1G6S021_9PSEU|nr:class III lanthionine synthetase LanKC [Actinokineospora iranica]SDD10004.1 Serine/threonine protein kinase [Actinokineospora iranica]